MRLALKCKSKIKEILECLLDNPLNIYPVSLASEGFIYFSFECFTLNFKLVLFRHLLVNLRWLAMLALIILIIFLISRMRTTKRVASSILRILDIDASPKFTYLLLRVSESIFVIACILLMIIVIICLDADSSMLTLLV